MNENANVMAALVLALGQIQNLKGKIDDEVIDHLAASGQDAIKSAHHFLDACEKTLELLTAKESEEAEKSTGEVDNVVDLKAHEG
jgi:hypothetical protein